MYWSNEDQDPLTRCESNNQALPIESTWLYSKSRWNEASPEDVDVILMEQDVTINFHNWCLTPRNFTLSEKLRNFWDVLATNRDENGLEFVSMVEAKDYSIWGVQYHPEKNAFEWTEKWSNIPHSPHAVYSAAFHADFLVKVSNLCDGATMKSK